MALAHAERARIVWATPHSVARNSVLYLVNPVRRGVLSNCMMAYLCRRRRGDALWARFYAELESWLSCAASLRGAVYVNMNSELKSHLQFDL